MNNRSPFISSIDLLLSGLTFQQWRPVKAILAVISMLNE